MKIVTRATAINNLKKYIGKDLMKIAVDLGITTFETGKQNKGWKGLTLERLAGLTNSNSKAPNGLGFELKSVAFKEVKGKLKPKETMAITMVNPEELKKTSFFKSHCWEKLKSLVFCAVMWHGQNAKHAELLEVTSLDFAEDDELIQEIKADYDFIRDKLIKEGFENLTGKDGEWIQARTKGIGGINPRTGKRRPITRAFYAKTGLVSKIFEISN
ncbi:hypothetical protein KAU19_05905 [Candidatus Parcubacteria bacterium]|nr:hypothetical protein [Candidatus Parcubacteria bacterium]